MRSLSHLAPFFIALAYLAIVIPLSRVFPPDNPDELVVTVNGYNFLSTGHIRYSLNDDVYPRAIYPLRDLSNHIARPLFDGWAGIWAVLGHRQTVNVRGCAISLGVGCLFFLYGIGRALAGPSLGITMMGLCVINPVFISASCVVNEHIEVFSFGLMLLYLAIRRPQMKDWGLVGYGALAALSLLIHQNAIILVLSTVLWAVLFGPEKTRLARFSLVLAGVIAGTLCDALLIDMPRMILFQKAIYWNFAKPPVLQWPWHPGTWILSTVKGMAAGSTYYFFSEGPLFAAWKYCQLVYWVSAVFLIWGSRRLGLFAERWNWILSVNLILGIFAISLLVRRQEAFYVLTLFPILIPWMALALENARRNRRWPLVAGAAVCFAGSVFLFTNFIWGYTHSYRPLREVVSEINRFLPPGRLRIAAPAPLWPYYPVEDFRDIGAAVTARYYTTASLRSLLGVWKPDILIAESSFRNAYRMPQPAPNQLSSQLGIPVHYLHSVQTGNSYGEWTIYQLLWPTDSASR